MAWFIKDRAICCAVKYLGRTETKHERKRYVSSRKITPESYIETMKKLFLIFEQDNTKLVTFCLIMAFAILSLDSSVATDLQHSTFTFLIF